MGSHVKMICSGCTFIPDVGSQPYRFLSRIVTIPDVGSEQKLWDGLGSHRSWGVVCRRQQEFPLRPSHWSLGFILTIPIGATEHDAERFGYCPPLPPNFPRQLPMSLTVFSASRERAANTFYPPAKIKKNSFEPPDK